MTVNVKKGDRVRVVLEGEATSEYEYGSFNIDGTHFINPNTHRHVVSVEVLAKQFKVGDTVTGQAEYDAVPAGTVVHNPGRAILLKLDNGKWQANDNPGASYTDLSLPRTIVYLPDAS